MAGSKEHNVNSLLPSNTVRVCGRISVPGPSDPVVVTETAPVRGPMLAESLWFVSEMSAVIGVNAAFALQPQSPMRPGMHALRSARGRLSMEKVVVPVVHPLAPVL